MVKVKLTNQSTKIKSFFKPVIDQEVQKIPQEEKLSGPKAKSFYVKDLENRIARGIYFLQYSEIVFRIDFFAF